MLRRFLFFMLVASPLGQAVSASDGVLSVDLIGGPSGPPFLIPFAYGDFNWNGVVDAHDLPIWRQGFARESFLIIATSSSGEANFDGRIDGGDFLVWQRNLGRNTFALPQSSLPTPPVTAVPEPASLIQLLLAAAPFALKRRRPAARLIRLAC